MKTYNQLEKPGFKDRWQRIGRTKAFSKPLARELAQDLVHTYLTGKERTLDQRISLFCRLCLTIDLLVGANYHDNAWYLMRAVTDFWAFSGTLSESDAKYIEVLSDQHNTTHAGSWYGVKLKMLALSVGHNHQLHSRIDMVTSRMSTYTNQRFSHFLLEAIDSVKGESNALLQAIRKYQAYGVKNCYFQDGIFTTPQEVWIVSNYEDLLTEGSLTSAHSALDEYLCLMGLGPRSGISQGIGFELLEKQNHFQKCQMTCETSFAFHLRRDGELDFSTSGTVPLRDRFQGQEASISYEILRLTSLLHLHDLVVPLEIVLQSPPLPTTTNQGVLADVPVARAFRANKLLDPTLVLRRIRLLEQHNDQISNMLEREIEEAANSDEHSTRRTMREHGVIWTTRRLPKGHKPSFEARERAKEYLDRPLADNETFVSAHTRGSGERIIKPHQAMVRRE